MPLHRVKSLKFPITSISYSHEYPTIVFFDLQFSSKTRYKFRMNLILYTDLLNLPVILHWRKNWKWSLIERNNTRNFKRVSRIFTSFASNAATAYFWRNLLQARLNRKYYKNIFDEQTFYLMLVKTNNNLFDWSLILTAFSM